MSVAALDDTAACSILAVMGLVIPIYFVSESHIYCKSVTMKQMSKDSIYATPSRTVLLSIPGMISK